MNWPKRKRPHGFPWGLYTSTSNRKLRRRWGVRGLRSRLDAHEFLLVAGLVVRDAIDPGVDREVAAHPDVAPRMDPRAALAHQNIAGPHRLPGVNLDSTALPRTVASVARRTLSLLMRHGCSPGCCSR